MKQLVQISILFILLTVSIFPQPWMLQSANIPSNAMVCPFEVAEVGDIVWVTTMSASGPRFYKSTDKGYNWTSIDLPGNQDLVMFPAFQNASTGIRVVFSFSQTYYKLEKTTDGGENWTEIPGGPYAGCVPVNVSYLPGTSDGYVITGNANVNGYSGGSAYTLDGGNTWTALDNGNYCYTIFKSDNVGWAMDWTTPNFYKYVGPPLPIPVELNSFTANVNDNAVNLNWSTATETNNKGFEVQRSEVGGQNSEWEDIGFVEGKGTTTDQHQYSLFI